ncbi:hypothetical protein cyc_01492 [Cyclospora cayetanensis]|uniref:Uncharacterized protein n=1 Tax=Cyclospora cayetanensis TaxID=88456 RepID=A0A1D3D6V9_9EIME|nr:hypothetical protein cyc_01492 [Cyclospora cayetanensis]
MEPGNGPSEQGTLPSHTESTHHATTERELLIQSNNSSDPIASQQRHPSASNLRPSAILELVEGEAPPHEGHEDESTNDAPNTRKLEECHAISTSASSLPVSRAPQACTDDRSYPIPQCLEDLSRLKQLSLRPNTFELLSEAFRASLCVIRCLRAVIRLHGMYACCGNMEQLRNRDTLGSSDAEALSLAASIMEKQMEFIADETAYDSLMKWPNTASETHGCVSVPSVQPGTHCTEGELTTDALPDTTSSPVIGMDAAKSMHGVTTTRNGQIKAVAATPEISELPPSTGPTSNGVLEYELSVCKALLLLQQLKPNSYSTVEESPTPPSLSPQSALSPRAAHRTMVPAPHSASFNTKKLMGLSAYRSGVPPDAIVDVLLRVRLLQGSQQLLRADFARLLHQQRKHQQQLKSAVQTTVMKLEAERDALLGRMQKLSTAVNRK